MFWIHHVRDHLAREPYERRIPYQLGTRLECPRSLFLYPQTVVGLTLPWQGDVSFPWRVGMLVVSDEAAGIGAQGRMMRTERHTRLAGRLRSERRSSRLLTAVR